MIIYTCENVCLWWCKGAELFDGILSKSGAALWPLIGILLERIVNMEHYCAFGGVYILRLIYQMQSRDQPVYCATQSTIKKWGKAEKGEEQKAISPNPKLR